MNLLCIDTATPLLILALVRDGERVAELAVQTKRRHGEVILGHIDTLLALGGFGDTPREALARLDAVAVTIGPGGFTALRVGLSTAKGICLAHDLPIYGVGALEVLARGAGPGEALVAPIVGAYKGEVFAAVYGADGERVMTHTAPFHGAPENVVARLHEIAEADQGGRALRAVGPGLLRFPEAFQGLRGVRLGPEYDQPSAAALCQAALVRVTGQPDDLDTLEPLYVKPSDAALPKPHE